MSSLQHEAANEALAWAPFDRHGDLLSEERAALRQHVDGCERCQEDEAGLARFLGAWERVVAEDRGEPGPNLDLVWERVQGELAAKEKPALEKPAREEPAPSVELGAGIEVRRLGDERTPSTCAFCHGYLAQRGRVLCRSCGAPHHLGCFRAHGRCSTMGCAQTRFERPKEVEEAPALRPAEWRLSLALRSLAAAASLLICLSAGALAWQGALHEIEDDHAQRALSVLDLGLQRVSSGFANVRTSLGEPGPADSVEPEVQARSEKIADERDLVLRRTLIELTRRTEVVAAALAYQGDNDGAPTLLMARVGQGAPSGIAYVRQRSLHEVSLPDGSFARADVGRLGDYRHYLIPSSVLRVRAPLRPADQVLEQGEVELWVFLDRGSLILARERTFHLVAFLTLAACCLVLGVFSWWCVRQRARVRRTRG